MYKFIWNISKKQYLHSGEEKYFSAGNRDCLVDIKKERIGLAICADIANPAHPEAIAIKNESIYAAGVLITREGYKNDALLLQNYALKYNMIIVMANYSKPTGGLIPAGKSTIWDNNGKLLAVAGETNRSLVVAKKESGRWSGSITNF